jgi:hypothetical protein
MTIAADFEDVYRVYAALAEKLDKALETGDAEESEAAGRTVLMNRHYLAGIEEMHARVLRLSADWKENSSLLDPATRDKAQHFIAAARAQALRLHELCDVYVQKLQRSRARILKDMDDIGRGTQLLNSLKPVKANYPKFIDSVF